MAGCRARRRRTGEVVLQKGCRRGFGGAASAVWALFRQGVGGGVHGG
jgi:hypothetical protein